MTQVPPDRPEAPEMPRLDLTGAAVAGTHAAGVAGDEERDLNRAIAAAETPEPEWLRDIGLTEEERAMIQAEINESDSLEALAKKIVEKAYREYRAIPGSQYELYLPESRRGQLLERVLEKNEYSSVALTQLERDLTDNGVSYKKIYILSRILGNLISLR